MSRILLSFPSPIYLGGQFHTGCFYEGFINALRAEGNEIMIMNTFAFLHQSINNRQVNFPPYIDKSKLVADVRHFNPQLVITFNHSIPREIEEACTCPIVIWDVDSVEFLAGKDYIRANLDKYIYIELGRTSAEKLIAFGAPAHRVHTIRSATAIRAQSQPVRNNIAFIGNPFFGPRSMANLLKLPNRNTFIAAAQTFAEDFYADIETVLSPADLATLARYMHPTEFKAISSGQNRLTALNGLSDLGLAIWGPSSWLDTAPYLPQVAMAYNKEAVFSLAHNQAVYNTSKIGVSIAHAQAADGYPWRVMDIMASNACLLSDHHSGIDDLTRGYVKLPMFHSPHEARDIARKLLKDDAWRKDLVEGSQKCIDETSRWHHRFKDVEQIIGVPLLAKKAKPAKQGPQVITIRREDYLAQTYGFYNLAIRLAARILPYQVQFAAYQLLKKCGIYVDSKVIQDNRR